MSSLDNFKLYYENVVSKEGIQLDKLLAQKVYRDRKRNKRRGK